MWPFYTYELSSMSIECHRHGLVWHVNKGCSHTFCIMLSWIKDHETQVIKIQSKKRKSSPGVFCHLLNKSRVTSGADILLNTGDVSVSCIGITSRSCEMLTCLYFSISARYTLAGKSRWQNDVKIFSLAPNDNRAMSPPLSIIRRHLIGRGEKWTRHGTQWPY